MSKVQITDVILRDSHQSLLATRMRTEDMLPALELLDQVGYYSLEMWGGATFDVAMRFLNECPWERLRTIRKHVKNTKLQMLLRGQNLVGYRHYGDDLVYAFVAHAHEQGIDVFRIFDAVNDIRNLQEAMRAARKVGAIVEGSISYTISPVHTIGGFVAFAQQLKDEGAELICIKDMAGMMSPADATALVGALKSEIGLPVHLHTHCASGMAPATILAAVQAGCDIVDTALSPLSWGTSHMPTESAVGMLRGTPWDTGLSLEKLDACAQHFDKVRELYMPLLDPRSERVDTRILQHQIPGGMMSNLLSQLKAQKAEDKFDEVLLETARVRKDLGYPPLVTPTSQIVGTQAVFNVALGQRYKMVTNEVRNYIKGLYGASPAPIDPGLAAQVLGGEEPITVRPGSLFPPELEGHIAKVAEWGPEYGLEQALSYGMFPQVAEEFFAARREGRLPKQAEPRPEAMVPKAQEVTAEPGDRRDLTLEVGGERSVVQVASTPGGALRLTLDGATYEVKVLPRSKQKRAKKAGKDEGGEGLLRAPLPGVLLTLRVSEGDVVEQGQVVAVLEAMKMQNELEAPIAGEVTRLLAKQGAVLEGGQAILEIAAVKAD
ncbi:MAG: pyruvate/oxaloacetate carboxyltransferase [Pseudomonadota bacterium]